VEEDDHVIIKGERRPLDPSFPRGLNRSRHFPYFQKLLFVSNSRTNDHKKKDMIRATKSQLSQHVLPFCKVVKRPQTKLHTDTMSGSTFIWEKKSKFIVLSKLSCSTGFSLCPYFIKSTTTDIDMLLQI